MNKREVEKLLKEAGFTQRGGGKHDIWIKPGFPPIPVPRHKGDIPPGTVSKILKHAGLEVRK